MKVFEYVIAFIPKDKRDEHVSDLPATILADKKVLASDASKAGIIAARQIPEAYLNRLDEIEVIVRPFN